MQRASQHHPPARIVPQDPHFAGRAQLAPWLRRAIARDDEDDEDDEEGADDDEYDDKDDDEGEAVWEDDGDRTRAAFPAYALAERILQPTHALLPTVTLLEAEASDCVSFAQFADGDEGFVVNTQWGHPYTAASIRSLFIDHRKGHCPVTRTPVAQISRVVVRVVRPPSPRVGKRSRHGPPVHHSKRGRVSSGHSADRDPDAAPAPAPALAGAVDRVVAVGDVAAAGNA